MFERNQRAHMNCVIEKKKAEEIVDEQSKPLPPLLGINMSTDPRYLHFSGERMAISCDSGKDHRQMPPMPFMEPPPPPPHLLRYPPPHMQSLHYGNHHPQMGISSPGASSSSPLPIHIIGPIPINGHHSQQQHESYEEVPMATASSSHHQPMSMIPILVSADGNEIEDLSPFIFSGHGESSSSASIPHPFLIQNHRVPQQQQQQHVPVLTSGEFRERALPHPIPIMPRQHGQHGE